METRSKAVIAANKKLTTMKKEIENYIKEKNLVKHFETENHAEVYPVGHDHYLITDGDNAIIILQEDYAELTLPRNMRRPIQDIFPYLTNMERNWLQMGCYFGPWDGKSFPDGIKPNIQEEELNW